MQWKVSSIVQDVPVTWLVRVTLLLIKSPKVSCFSPKLAVTTVNMLTAGVWQGRIWRISQQTPFQGMPGYLDVHIRVYIWLFLFRVSIAAITWATFCLLNDGLLVAPGDRKKKWVNSLSHFNRKPLELVTWRPLVAPLSLYGVSWSFYSQFPSHF